MTDRRAAPPALRQMLAEYRATPIGGGASGATVLRLDAPGREPLVLKTAAGDGAHELARERDRLQWLHGRIPCPKVQASAITDDDAWLLTSLLPGIPARDAIAQRPADTRAIVESLAHFLRDLHALPTADCPFDAGVSVRMADARRRVSAGLVDEDDFDDARRGWTAKQVLDAVLASVPVPSAAVVTHGDFTLDNVLVDGTRVTGCLDVGRLGVGDPHQDLALCRRDLVELGPEWPLVFFSACGLRDPDPARVGFFLLLDELF